MRLSIRSKLLFSFLSLMVILALALGVSGHLIMVRHLEAVQKEHLLALVEQEAGALESMLRDTASLLEKIADSTGFKAYISMFKEHALVSLFENFADVFQLLTYADEEGFENVKVVGGAAYPSLSNIKKLPVFNLAMQNRNQVTISPELFFPELNTYAVPFSLARYNYFDDFIGVLMGATPVSHVTQLLLEPKIGETGFFCLLNSEGLILHYPNEEFVFHKIDVERAEAQEVLYAAKSGKIGVVRGTLLGIDGLYAYAPVKDTAWIVLAVLPYEEINAAPNRLRNASIVISVTLFVFCSLLALAISWSIARPLTRLAAVTAAVAKGDFSQKADVRSGDELGALGSHFDSMIRELAQSKEEVARATAELENRVLERTETLAEINRELQLEIQERMRIEDDLRKAMDAAQAANIAKSRFLANMSHELRTPLHQIIGFMQLIIHGPQNNLNEKQERYLSLSIKSSQHLLSLINEILDISKVEAGRFNLQLSEVDLASLIEESLVMARDKAVGKKFEISVRIDDIPDRIVADYRILRQILDNLLSNAAKFTGEGGTIQLRACSIARVDGHLSASDGKRLDLPEQAGGGASSDTGFVEVTVTDTGVGIREEDLERIFDPFEQVDSSFSKRFEGAGLGLALTREFVNLHGGLIWAESQGLGKGSSFRFVIPVSQPPGVEKGPSN